MMRRFLVVPLVLFFFSMAIAVPGHNLTAKTQTHLRAPTGKAFVLKLEGDVNNDMLIAVWSYLVAAKELKTDYLDIRINSNGGNVESGLGIIDAIVLSGYPTVCTVESNGKAMSMAAVILESSACGMRRMHPNALVMIHSAGVQTQDRLDEATLKHMVGVIHALNGMMSEIICGRSGCDADKLNTMLENGGEKWCYGKECKQAGLVDEVLPVIPPTSIPQ